MRNFKFKKGDILYIKSLFEHIIIYDNCKDGVINATVDYLDSFITTNVQAMFFNDIKEKRLATKEEETLLFDELKKQKNLVWNKKKKVLIDADKVKQIKDKPNPIMDFEVPVIENIMEGKEVKKPVKGLIVKVIIPHKFDHNRNYLLCVCPDIDDFTYGSIFSIANVNLAGEFTTQKCGYLKNDKIVYPSDDELKEFHEKAFNAGYKVVQGELIKLNKIDL